MAIIVGGRTKFESMRALQRENDFLMHRLEEERKLNHHLEYRLIRLGFSERWHMTAAGKLRQRIVNVLDSLLAQRLFNSGGNYKPSAGFNILSSRCLTCDGTGGTRISEEELDDSGIVYEAGVHAFHDPTEGYEYWCDDCVGTGSTLDANDWIGA